ncbi:MAG: GntR family transcriptional regulator [Candidimonas sp.]|nr:MAG: GntR family transcriptional regulator [Candidimonas sp.]TAM23575.1 MAG: GntR family transcriptional regulator [Candidimonas sp.]TAM77294.1 MAG: GntR family transcriptional regulator [Candidimonas sp.]
MKDELDAGEAKRLLALFGEPSQVIWTLPEQIADKLAEDIIRGVFAPGQPLMETMLAETHFHVSRGPVREALRILEREGLVENRPRRGAIVTKLSPSDIKEIFDVRAVLYGFVSAQLARQRSAKVVELLNSGTASLLEAFEQKNVDDFLHTLYRLSMYLAEAAGNSRARKIIFSHGRQTLSTTRRVMQVRENCSIWISNWKNVIKAIEVNDAINAEQAGRMLVNAVYEGTVKILEASASTSEVENPAFRRTRRKAPADAEGTGARSRGKVTAAF